MEFVDGLREQADSYLDFLERDEQSALQLPRVLDGDDCPDEDLDGLVSARIARLVWSEEEILQMHDENFNPAHQLPRQYAILLQRAAYDWLKTNGYPAQYAEEGVLLSIAGRDSPESHFATGASQERLQEIASWSRSPGGSWSRSLLEEPEEEAIPMDVEKAGYGTILPCGATLTSYLIQDKTILYGF